MLRRKISAYPPKGSYPFLDPRAAGIVQTDHRSTGPEREIHDLYDLFRVRFGERAAEDGEILRKDENQASVDAAVARHHTVAEILLMLEPEVGGAVGHETVHLDE